LGPGIIAINKNPKETSRGPEQDKCNYQRNKKTRRSNQYGINISFLHFRNLSVK
jgi:hypothetical protein